MQTELPTLTPKQVLLAGNATFTIESLKTGQRFTFKVRQPDEDKPHFVSLMSGPDNESNFSYLGFIGDRGYAHGKKSTISENATSARAFAWLWENIDNLPVDKVRFLPACRCCRCGRTLTVPTSIENAIGPECAKKLS